MQENLEPFSVKIESNFAAQSETNFAEGRKSFEADDEARSGIVVEGRVR
jgi:hypothetical protein